MCTMCGHMCTMHTHTHTRGTGPAGYPGTCAHLPGVLVLVPGTVPRVGVHRYVGWTGMCRYTVRLVFQSSHGWYTQ